MLKIASKEIIKKNTLIGLTILISIIAVFVMLFLDSLNHSNEIFRLRNNWKVYLNGNLIDSQPTDTLDKYVIPEAKKSDVIKFKNQLDNINIDNPTLIFDTWYTLTEVYIDKQKIYSYGEEYLKNQTMLGGKRHEVALPQHYQGKTLTIKLTFLENRNIKSLRSPAITPFGSDKNFWYNRTLLIIFPSFLFLLIGVLVYISSYLFLLKTTAFLSSMMIGLNFMTAGIYFLCRAKVICLICPNPAIYNQIEFITMYLFPLSLLVYAFNLRGIVVSKKIAKLYYINLTTYIISLLSMIIINNTTSIHYPTMNFIFYIEIFFTYTMINILLKKSDKKDIWIKITSIAIKTFIIGCSISMIAFYSKENPFLNDKLMLWKLYEYILIVSTFCMLVLFLIGFYLNIKHSILINLENDKLQFLARYDALTTLRNRRSFTEKLNELNKYDDIPNYTVIVIDLNGLKYINDTFGHAIGDDVLIELANAMHKIPESLATSYRIGGDEFVIIVNENEHTNLVVEILNTEIEKTNSTLSEYSISIAIGIATRSENGNPYDLFNIADRRMYETKSKMKSLRI